MTELSFSAVILNGKSWAEAEGEKEIVLRAAVDLFYDSGVEDIIVSSETEIKSRLSEHPVLRSKGGEFPWDDIRRAAFLMEGTHLLVLESVFEKMAPAFLIRLMQMSCLGMGVLPFVEGIPQPLAACYPASIVTLESQLQAADFSAVEKLALLASNKGLVARYDVPAKDAIFFEKTVSLASAATE